ncbi:E3 SUMO-protein ligase pli1 [Teratosphaeriaceae sp. CCFEE 6253]|nr:E3 SUMO-protein ligase pli1 [Teratosphaeriaceae sp. CCFEE 6253]
MATSAGHMLQQTKSRLHTQLKRLVNTDLKEICRAYHKGVSGNKAELQKRCLDILDEIVDRGDPDAVDEFGYRVQNKGQPQPRQILNGPAATYPSPMSNQGPSGHQPYAMPPGRTNAMPTLHKLPAAGKYFKSSPFYEIQDTVVSLTDLAEMPQNRNTVRANICLTLEQSTRLANSDMRLLLYCGLSAAMSPYHPVDIAFPNQVEVKINDDEVKSNYKGLKNKPGSTKPADLTQKVRAKPNYPNQIILTYALTMKKYAFVVHLVRYVNATILTERIRTGSIIPKERVIAEMRKANADPDIEATSTRMSLKDPVSTMRITLPVRSTVCTHTQCFDGAMFLQLVEQAPQWNCPVCNKTVSFQSLCVDKYFEDILSRTPKSIEKVDVEPDGEWRMIQEGTEQQADGTTNKPRASYDDDFDDDLVEVPDPSNKPVNSVKYDSQPLLSPFGAPPFSINTPPLSSREPSVAQSVASGAYRAGSVRPSGAIIDLTLSDEDDEPPRPAKRQQTATSNQQQQQGTQNSHSAQQQYHTPSSLPDHSRYQPPPPPPPPPPQSYRQADHYRPSTRDEYRPASHAGPPPASPLRAATEQHRHSSMSGGRQSTGEQPSYSRPATVAHPAPPPPSAPAFNFAVQRPPITPWPAEHSRPPSQSNLMQPFSLRPPSSPGGMQSPQHGGMRLPSIHSSLPPPPPSPGQSGQGQNAWYGGRRSDGSERFSGSPG